MSRQAPVQVRRELESKPVAHLTFFLFAFAAVLLVIAAVPLLVGGAIVAILAAIDAKAVAQRKASGQPVEARSTWMAFIGVSAIGLVAREASKPSGVVAGRLARGALAALLGGCIARLVDCGLGARATLSRAES